MNIFFAYGQKSGLVLDLEGNPLNNVSVFFSDQNILINTTNDGSFSFDYDLPKCLILRYLRETDITKLA